MGALARHDSIIPGVAFLKSPAPIKGHRRFARPRFRGWTGCFSRSSQAGFCPCTLRRISDPAEPTFGHPRSIVEGVPPQPSGPPTAVPGVGLAAFSEKGSVTWAPPPRPQAGLRRLLPTLCISENTATAGCRRAPRGLLFPPGVRGLCTAKAVSPGVSLGQRGGR